MLIKVDIHRGNLTIWDNVAGSPGEQALTVDFEEPGNKLDPMFDAIMKGVLDRAYNVLTSDSHLQQSDPVPHIGCCPSQIVENCARMVNTSLP